MKFYSGTVTLRDAINKVGLAVSQKSTIQVLEGILFEAHGNKVRLTGYNMELSISAEIEARVLEEGDIIIPAKLFSDIVRKSEGTEITISADNRFLVEINSGASHFTILGMSALEFPEVPVVKNCDSFKIPQNKLFSMIAQVLFAVSTSDSKPAYTGVLFEVNGEEISLVAVDGFRLALRKEKIKTNVECRFIVPGKALSEVLKLLEDNDEEVEIFITSKNIMFSLGGCTVTSRLLEGEFLDYHAAIPAGAATTVVASTRGLQNSIERTGLLITEKVKSPLKLEFKSDKIILSCSTTIGKAYDEFECTTTGDELTMGFNNKFLLDALKFADTEMVKFELSGPLSPMKVLPTEGDHFLFLVLPMRLKYE